MGIFTDKLEMSKRIEEQEQTIDRLKSEISDRTDEIANLSSKLKTLTRQNADYKNRYVNTGLECEFCYTVLQKNFSFCPKCGKPIKKSYAPTAKNPNTNLFTTEDDSGCALIAAIMGSVTRK